MPGFGRPDKPASANAYSLQWIEDIALLLDELKIGKAHIVGYSMGGIVALKFIAEHPDRVYPVPSGVWDGFRKAVDYERFGNTCAIPP